jgi:hypothetical protein
VYALKLIERIPNAVKGIHYININIAYELMNVFVFICTGLNISKV